MTTDKEQSATQPPGDEQTKGKRTRSSGNGRTPKSQTQKQQSSEPQREVQEQEVAAPRGQSELSQLLQQQIAQAIQPVLAEFRTQVARTVHEETQSGPAHAANGVGTEQGAQQLLSRQEQSKPAKSEQPAQETASAQPSHQPEGQQGDASAEGDQGSAGPVQALQGVGGKVTGTLHPVVRVAEEQAEHWLQSLLIAGLSALLSERTREAAQRQAERGLHVLLEKAFQALPDNASNRDLRLQTERTLQAIMREAIDAVFAEQTRSTVQEHGEHVVREALHGRFGTALDHAQDALRSMVQAFVEVLRRQWQRVLRLLLKIILTALESSLVSSEDEKPAEGGAAKGSTSSK